VSARAPLGPWLAAIEATDDLVLTGRLGATVGTALQARVPGCRTGDLVEIQRSTAAGGPLLAEVVGFDGATTWLSPLADPAGLAPGDPIRPTGAPLSIVAGPEVLGRVLDGLGRPIDGGPPLSGPAAWPVDRSPPDPVTRPRLVRPLAVGIRAIDGPCTLAEGQRVGLFAAAGVGKSTLLGQIARQADADVFVVCLVGERGRELREFLDDALGEAGRARGVVVCATSDAPARVRMRSVAVATALAEWFRDRAGKRVLLLVDSLTRYARAAREVGLAVGEPPARRGYPPSVFAGLPPLLERAGTAAPGGSVTGIYTVLVEGDDHDEPVADELRGLLDGHVVLRRHLAERGHFPAIDVPASLSRSMPAVTTERHRSAAGHLRTLLSTYESQRDLVLLGAYRRGSDPKLDRAMDRMPEIEAFLRQGVQEHAPLPETLSALDRAVGAAKDGVHR
jgi:type III secretion protein N (ATPase)